MQTTLEGVREFTEGEPVALVRLPALRGRLAIEALNEGRNNNVLIDVLDLVSWLRQGPPESRTTSGFSVSLAED